MQRNPECLISELKEKREEMMLSQSRLSKRIGISHTSISRIEDGKMNPTLKIFISMANELGYEVILQKIEKQNTEVNKTFIDDSLKVQEKTK